MKKWVAPILALLLLVVFIKKTESGCRSIKGAHEEALREDRFWEHPAFVSYSHHARCRMQCRRIDEYEVNEILKKGTLNRSRIRREERGTTYPLEGITRDGQRVRIVVAPRANGLDVVTCIDLDTDWPCNCP